MAKKNRIIQHSEECPELHHPENDEQYTGLQVNSGVEQPPIVNPYLKRKRKPQLTPAEYVEGRRIGITGVPGAGKSTSIDSFGMHVIKQGHKLAVLAIDPSSERSKGSILGDKTRMERLAVEPDVFIRPSPSAGSLGGVARKTRETIVLCEAAGYDTIFVETVGVGQSEIAVHSMVDYFLLIQLAGTGDELQGIKRGIMEMADGIVINKCDGDNIERAKLAAAQFRNALHLYPLPPSGFLPEVITYSGYYDLDIDKVWDMIDRYFAHVKANGYFDEKRHEQERYWMRETINEQLLARFYFDPEIERLLSIKEDTVLAGKQTSFVAASDVLNFYYDKITKQHLSK